MKTIGKSMGAGATDQAGFHRGAKRARATASQPVSRVRRDAMFRVNTATAALGNSNRKVRKSFNAGTERSKYPLVAAGKFR
jgi:hypothetical protein